MKCPRCQNEVNDENQFCPYCGERLKKPEDHISQELKEIRLKQVSFVMNRILNIAANIAVVFTIIGLFGPVISTSYADIGGLSWFAYEGWVFLNDGAITQGPFYTTFSFYLLLIVLVITVSSHALYKAINGIRRKEDCKVVPHIILLSIAHRVYSAIVYSFYYERISYPGGAYETSSAWGSTLYGLTIPLFTVGLIVFLIMKTFFTGTTKKTVSHIFALVSAFILLNSIGTSFTYLGFMNTNSKEDGVFGIWRYFEFGNNYPAHVVGIIIATFILGLIAMGIMIAYGIITIKNLVKHDNIARKTNLILAICFMGVTSVIFVLDMIFGFALNGVNDVYTFIPLFSTDLAAVLFVAFFVLGLSIAMYAMNADKKIDNDNIIDQEVVEKKDA